MTTWKLWKVAFCCLGSWGATEQLGRAQLPQATHAQFDFGVGQLQSAVMPAVAPSDYGGWRFRMNGYAIDAIPGGAIVDEVAVSGCLNHLEGPHANESHSGQNFDFEFRVCAIAADAAKVENRIDNADGSVTWIFVRRLNAAHPAGNNHVDEFTATLSIVTRPSLLANPVCEFISYDVRVVADHKLSLQDGGIQAPTKLDAGGATKPWGVGSDGVVPRINIWGPEGYGVPVGTPYCAVLIEDVKLPFATTKPIAMLGLSTTSAFGGTVALPLDLAPLGAPGFMLAIDPLAFLPGQAPTGNHHAELPLSIPNDPALIGTHIWWQWVLNDPTANALGKTFTPAVLMILVP